jgi:hypothetical protein
MEFPPSCSKQGTKIVELGFWGKENANTRGDHLFKLKKGLIKRANEKIRDVI